jgi:selenocysteine lyase/cysteine desulfurase
MAMHKVLEHFPVRKHVIYMNHAAVGPLPQPTVEAMQRHAHDQRDFGAMHWRDWYAEHDALRASAARLIGATPPEISLLKNTSEGIAFVAEGYRWQQGENVVTTDLEFPSNYSPWMNLARRGVECRIARGEGGRITVEDIERMIDARTRIVTVSSVAFHNGFAAELDSIGALCESRGILFCVDAIQSLGVIPIDVRRAKISFLAADGHKWLLGPEGTAIFYAAAEHRERLDVLEHGWTNVQRHGRFIECGLELLEDGRRFEAGSLNTNGAYGLRASIDLLLETGIEAIHAEVIRLCTRLADGLEELGFRLGTPRPIASGIVGATPPDVEKASVVRLHRLLEEQRIVCAPREGMLRFSPHFYNGDDEIDGVIETLARLTR